MVQKRAVKNRWKPSLDISSYKLAEYLVKCAEMVIDEII